LRISPRRTKKQKRRLHPTSRRVITCSLLRVLLSPPCDGHTPGRSRDLRKGRLDNAEVFLVLEVDLVPRWIPQHTVKSPSPTRHRVDPRRRRVIGNGEDVGKLQLPVEEAIFLTEPPDFIAGLIQRAGVVVGGLEREEHPLGHRRRGGFCLLPHERG